VERVDRWHLITEVEYEVLISCLVYSSTLKMEAICSSKMSVYILWTTRCHIPEERTIPSVVSVE
jgi:hypothetical protein